MYKVTVTQKVMDTSRLNPYFTIQKALTKKNIANDIYRNEWCPPPERSEDANCEHAMKRAIRLYSNAAEDMEALLQGAYFKHVEEAHPQRDECRQILLDSRNNIVAVYMRKGEYNAAKEAAVEVLKVDPNNTKALLRAAKASLLDPASSLDEVSEATKAAESAIATNSKDKSADEKELKRLKTQLKKTRLEYKKRTKEMFSNKLGPVTPISKEEGASDENLFWKNHFYTALFHAVFPLLIFFLYRFSFDYEEPSDNT